MKHPPLLRLLPRFCTPSLAAFVVAAGWACLPPLHAAPVIDLRKPVTESVPAPTGIYWSGNTITPGTPYDSTPDGSGNGYSGFLLQGVGSYSTTTGVNKSWTSGYGNAIRLTTAAVAPGGDGNPKIQINLPNTVPNALEMVATDFTGGLWVKLDSLLTGAQTITLINRGPWNLAMGHWGLNLQKNISNQWEMAFQTGDGTQHATVTLALPVEMTITTGTWYHFGFNYQHGAGADPNTVSFWMDGTLLGSRNIAVDIAADTGTLRRFVVGERTTTGYNSVFNGSVDDIFVTTGIYEFQTIPEANVHALLLFGAGALLLLRKRAK